ncbi:MAG TPA: ABC transporter ATP-binding protein [Kofleriaceae bacterium]|jgi:ATP-binding cassette subfamily B protein|nr:ABC transporter ATP-binding protein [Kofleriaceae bacterium]
MTTPNRAPAASSERPSPPPRGPFAFAAGPPQKSKNFKASARRLIRQLAPDRSRLYGVLAFAVLSVTMTISGPWIMSKALNVIYAGYLGMKAPAGLTKDQVIAGMRAAGERTADMASRYDFTPGVGLDFARLGQILLLVLVLYMFASLFTWLQSYTLNIVVQRRIRALRAEVQAKMNRLPLSYFDQQPRGELLSRVTNDIDNIATGLQQALSQILGSALGALGALIMLVVVSRLLAVIALVTVPLSVIATARIGKRSQSRFVAQWKHVGALNGQLEEAFTGHALVNVFGRRGEIEAKFRAKNDELYEASFRAQFISSIIMPAINFIGNLGYVATAVVGGLRVAAGAILLGDVQAFMQYSRMFTQNLSQLAQVSNVLQSGVASAERVFEVLDAAEQSADPEIPATIPAVRGEVRFEHVSFRYKPEQPLIADLSLVAEPGQTVAIVGPTGAGKTTLVNLIMRFYELDAGRITIDGVDIAKLTRRELRGEIGMVLQDTWLFGGTIRDNLRYGNPAATEAELVAAAKATYVDRFVRALPLGYDTVLDEAGNNISAGEKQLITIARAFLADPAILILDEATSSVDTRTEVLVQQAMAALRAKRTSFVIAHRLSTIRNANLILVMEAGQIVEQGSHEQLLAARGAYHDLYHAQFAAAAVAPAA